MRVVEVACDESGAEGEHLVGGNTDVFAHAGVQLTIEAATDCVRELRSRIGSPAQEYKANHLLRGKSRPALEWLLGSTGPIHGRARVHLVDKPFFVVRRIIELLLGNRAAAVPLYREGRAAFAAGRWRAFLRSSNDLLRRNHREAASVDGFFHSVDGLPAHGPASEVVARLRQARPRAGALRDRLVDDPRAVPPLDTLIPALVAVVDHWSRNGLAVVIVHDQHVSLTAHRIAQLTERVGAGRLAGVELVDSRTDPRVQVADFLAGVARKVAEDELTGRGGDPALTALLRQYVDPRSVWAGPLFAD